MGSMNDEYGAVDPRTLPGNPEYKQPPDENSRLSVRADKLLKALGGIAGMDPQEVLLALADMEVIDHDKAYLIGLWVGSPRTEITVSEERTMIRLPTGGHHICHCGSSVFRKRSDGKYKCNTCGFLFTTENPDAQAKPNQGTESPVRQEPRADT